VFNSATHLRALLFSFISLTLIGCASLDLPDRHKSDQSEESTRETARDLFAIFDINSDGFLTRDELGAGLRYMARVDRTGDSSVFALRSKRPSRRGAARPRPQLTDQQISELVTATFSADTAVPGRSLTERLSQSEFEKIVIDSSAPSARDETLSGAAGWRRFL
jgi:hypothetical protein